MVIMFISILINQFENTSITILCRLSHHFCSMLLDCHVHSHSILLLSALRYLDRYFSYRVFCNVLVVIFLDVLKK